MHESRGFAGDKLCINRSIAVWTSADDSTPTTPTFEEHPAFRPVRLSERWLNTLTPSVNSSIPGWTTLASVIQSVVQPEYKQQIPALVIEDVKTSLYTSITSVVASFIVDGMSRVGWEENDLDVMSENAVCYSPEFGCPWDFNTTSWEKAFSALISGDATLTSSSLQKSGKEYYWAATVAGQALSAKSTAYYLAIGVLFVHLALVVAHTAYTLARRRTIPRWSSLTDLLVLRQVSPPPTDALRNTCTGVDSHHTLRLRLRIREAKIVPAGQQSLQLMIEPDDGDRVQDGVDYGAKI